MQSPYDRYCNLLSPQEDTVAISPILLAAPLHGHIEQRINTHLTLIFNSLLCFSFSYSLSTQIDVKSKDVIAMPAILDDFCARSASVWQYSAFLLPAPVYRYRGCAVTYDVIAFVLAEEVTAREEGHRVAAVQPREFLQTVCQPHLQDTNITSASSQQSAACKPTQLVFR